MLGIYSLFPYALVLPSLGHLPTMVSWMLLDWGGGDGLLGLTLTVPPV